ncbi:MAG: ABC transporter permease [Limisphaerales bacterium]
MYFLRRVIFLIPLLLIISMLAFGLMRLAPGGPFDKERAPASPEIERNLKAKYHLDKPIHVQYWIWLSSVVKGDFGPSLQYRSHNVNDIIADGLPITLVLGGLSFCFAIGLGIPVGFATAVKKGEWQDYLGSFLSILAICIPALVVGPILVMVFAVQWELLPVALVRSPMHLILPTITLGLYFAGRVARLMREGMLGTLDAEFITAARAKGVSESSIVLRHAFRIGVLPVISYSGPLFADVMIGSFVVENLFRIPGIGVFLVNSSLNRDYTLLISLVLLYAVAVLVANLIVDLAYSRLDPRVKI